MEAVYDMLIERPGVLAPADILWAARKIVAGRVIALVPPFVTAMNQALVGEPRHYYDTTRTIFQPWPQGLEYLQMRAIVPGDNAPRTERPNAPRPQARQTRKPSTRSVYQSTQTVHTTSINESAIQIAKELCAIQFVQPISFSEAIQLLHNSKAHEALLAHLESEIRGISIRTLFVKVVQYICEFEKGDFTRLHTELVEAHGLCTTGLFHRLVNTISGFQPIQISVDEQWHARFKAAYPSVIQAHFDQYERFLMIAVTDKHDPIVSPFARDVRAHLCREFKNETDIPSESQCVDWVIHEFKLA